jgi:hypothetical protein
MSRRIAILGAGITGSCIALELAAHGVKVDLIDERQIPVDAASLHNEGKIHLGLIYAKDQSLNTAHKMIRGATSFHRLMNRWVDFSESTVQYSTPFVYARHRDSLISPEQMAAHYEACQKIFDDVTIDSKDTYLGHIDRLHIERLSTSAWDTELSPEYFDAVFQTSELSVDPADVATLLQNAVHHESRVQFIGGSRVVKMREIKNGSFEITTLREGIEESSVYDVVVNSTWQGRLALDRMLGLEPERAWLHRYKLANRINVLLSPTDLPSITGVLGPFGDLVNFGSNGLFLSWYPDGVLGTSSNIEPTDVGPLLTQEAHVSALQRSLDEWILRSPALARLDLEGCEMLPGGGYIFAWGATDVDDPKSKLHDRYEIGVKRKGDYYSVDTGKYTTAPLIAFETAQSILEMDNRN